MAKLTFYKVVRRGKDGRLYSAWTSRRSRLCVEYKPGEWVEAPVGGLFVYKERWQAEGDLPSRPSKKYEIWQVEVKDPCWFNYIYDPKHLNIRNAKKFWRYTRHGKMPATMPLLFIGTYGTYVATAVKLVHKLEWYKCDLLATRGYV